MKANKEKRGMMIMFVRRKEENETSQVCPKRIVKNGKYQGSSPRKMETVKIKEVLLFFWATESPL